MQRSTLFFVILYFFNFSLAIAQHQHKLSSNNQSAILLPGLGQHRHPIATTNEKAQKFFDQGLIMIFGFNRPEAARSFRQAIALDSTAVMPYWGLALALGHHLNMDMDMDVQMEEAHAIIQKAVALSSNASQVERAYISALSQRCSADKNSDGKMLDSSYGRAMWELTRQYPDDVDAAALYAESLMCIHRYQWYDANGKPINEEKEIKTTLEAILRRSPNHLLANHLYIHLLDTSPYPEYGLASAYRLNAIASGAGMGHLIHMPSHIFMTLGDYDKTVKANQQAALADEEYVKLTGVKWNVYMLGYYPHNLHMIVRALMEQGLYNESKQAANKLANYVKPAFDQMPMMIDYYIPNDFFVQLRFQQWDEILNLAKPDVKMFMTTMLWHYARTLALAAKGRRQEAMTEQTAFTEARNKIPSDWMWTFNAPDKILNLAETIMKARLATDEKAAIEYWKEAVNKQDNLNYDEPPAWYYPVRESLGGELLREGQAEEAEAVFRENLKRFPLNGRSLFGLLKSLQLQKKQVDAEWVETEFKNVWSQSVPLPRIEDF
jgi:tetratricopeptide (TPR) repeat protein